jgi:hypothetical protein
LSELDLCAAAHSSNQFVAAVQFECQRRAAGERLMWFVLLLCEFHLLVSSLSCHCVVVLFVSHPERAEFVGPMTSCSKLQAAASVCASGSSVCAVLCWFISEHSRDVIFSNSAFQCWQPPLAPCSECRHTWVSFIRHLSRALSFAGGWRGDLGLSSACFECNRGAPFTDELVYASNIKQVLYADVDVEM